MSAFLLNPSTVYILLVVLRAFCALNGAGYIHPDEYFQNGEVTARNLLGWNALQTWEWNESFPCRSIVPPILTTGLPLRLLGSIWDKQDISPRYIFDLERLSFLLLSFVLDYSVYRLVPYRHTRRLALLLLSSSHVIHTFQIRPFSNSIEAVFLALSLVALQNVLYSAHAVEKTSSTLSLSFLAALMALGVFTRITFVAFVLPVAVEALLWTVRASRDHSTDKFSALQWLNLVILPLITACLVSFGIILADTIYFQGDLSKFVLTPLNFLLYNLSSENLALHGIHPRWLHIAINLPMIVGPCLLFYGVLAARDHLQTPSLGKDKGQEGVLQTMKRTCVYVIISSLAILSSQPHQEPRFLIPLLVPFIVLTVNSGRIERAGAAFWVLLVVFNVVMSVVFGFLHQGGVVPSLLYLSDQIVTTSTAGGRTSVFYWKTYMPPQHLLGVTERDVQLGLVSITDFAGSPPHTLIQSLKLQSVQFSKTNVTPFLVTSPWAINSLSPQFIPCFKLQKQIFPHLDLDHLPESVEAGWRDGLSLGVYVVDPACILWGEVRRPRDEGANSLLVVA